jgi:hypothetical protein
VDSDDDEDEDDMPIDENKQEDHFKYLQADEPQTPLFSALGLGKKRKYSSGCSEGISEALGD